MNIERGWAFFTANFSLVVAGNVAHGRVTLVRSGDDRRRWHTAATQCLAALSDPAGELPPDFPPLYVTGFGPTVEEAVVNANRAAADAAPIL